jgi:hypothetical protein
MATTREVERLARSLIAQRTDPLYVVHYLVETYQIDLPTAQAVVDKVAPPRLRKSELVKATSGKSPAKSDGPKRTTFY